MSVPTTSVAIDQLFRTGDAATRAQLTELSASLAALLGANSVVHDPPRRKRPVAAMAGEMEGHSARGADPGPARRRNQPQENDPSSRPAEPLGAARQSHDLLPNEMRQYVSTLPLPAQREG